MNVNEITFQLEERFPHFGRSNLMQIADAVLSIQSRSDGVRLDSQDNRTEAERARDKALDRSRAYADEARAQAAKQWQKGGSK